MRNEPTHFSRQVALKNCRVVTDLPKVVQLQPKSILSTAQALSNETMEIANTAPHWNCGESNRILIVDDTKTIHDDFRKTLQGNPIGNTTLDDLTAAVFGKSLLPPPPPSFDLESAFQGEEAIEKIREANKRGVGFSMAFIDVRMPPGMDGVQATSELLKIDPYLQIVICTAHSDYTWNDLSQRFGTSDRVLILKKPFDTVEVRQLVSALTCKWSLVQRSAQRTDELDRLVRERTKELEAISATLRNDVTTLARTERERKLANKFELVGQLAAGLAREINAPMQTVDDNILFLQRSFDKTWTALTRCAELCRNLNENKDITNLLPPALDALEELDLEVLERRIPKAFECSADSVEQVTSIVHAVEKFSHASSKTKSVADIERSLTNTLNIVHNAYKQLAVIETDFCGLPLVAVNISDLNQVFLNLIINACQAISTRTSSSPLTGIIRIITQIDDESVVIKINDNGIGIPEQIRDRIFDPFFSTKDVGAGQGLAIARSIVVDKHGGSITVKSEPGQGSSFSIRLPIKNSAPDTNEASR